MIPENKKQELIDKALYLVGEHKLVYLTLYGSHLYGLNTPSSDIDIKGIFIPSFKSLITSTAPNEISTSTGDSNSRNTSDDTDIKLFSIQKFIKLCKEVDSNGTDLFFSGSNKDAVLYKNNLLDSILDHPEKIMGLKDAKAYVGYAIQQAKKYGIKGSRLGVFKGIRESIEHILSRHSDASSEIDIKNLSLDTIVDEIIFNHYHESYCFGKEISNKNNTNERYLMVCGSCHQLNISIKEFYDRMVREENKYGWRTENAQEQGGIDWKALSHAVRVLYQCIDLYTTGKVSFPISEKDIVRSIKKGTLPYEEVEQLIIKLLEAVDLIKSKSTYCDIYKYNSKFIVEELERIYGEVLRDCE